MFRSLILAAVLLASAPLIANAGEITLLPSVKLQIGDRDDYGRYWDGGYWRDRDYWNRHYEWRGDRWRSRQAGWGWWRKNPCSGRRSVSCGRAHVQRFTFACARGILKRHFAVWRRAFVDGPDGNRKGQQRACKDQYFHVAYVAYGFHAGFFGDAPALTRATLFRRCRWWCFGRGLGLLGF